MSRTTNVPFCTVTHTCSPTVQNPPLVSFIAKCCENMPMMTDESRRTEEWDEETGRRVRQRDSPSPLQRELSACCRHSGYKQKVFSPLTSSTGPSAGRRHRNAHYSQGVTATVCHQSVGLAALPCKTMPQQGHHSDSSWKGKGGTNRHDEIYTSAWKAI